MFLWNHILSNRKENSIHHPFSDWDPSCPDGNLVIPEELLSRELYDGCGSAVFDELCVLISLNRKIYDVSKYSATDTSILEKAVKGNYSKSLCLFVEKIPSILSKIENKKNRQYGR